MIERRLVMVTWNDAHAVTETWEEIDALDSSPCVVSSVGFVLPHVKPGHVVLAQSLIDGDGVVDNVLAIPVGMVRTVSVLSSAVVVPVEVAGDV
jgi:hypothetical protein